MTIEPTKQWQARNVKLTDEQRSEIINSTLSNKEIAEIYNSNPKTISQIRRRHEKGITNKRGGANNRKLTDSQLQRVIENNERVVDLALEFGVTVSCISKIRSKSGISKVKSAKPKGKPVKSPPKKKKTINKLETAYEKEQKEHARAIKLAEDFKQTTEWKLQNGYSWQKGSMRSMVLRKTI